MIEYIIVALVAFLLGWHGRVIHAKIVVAKITKEFREEAMNEIKEKVINAYVEKAGDTLFVYSKEDGSFLAQGKDLDELTDILMNRFPDKLFNVSPEDLKMLEATEGKK